MDLFDHAKKYISIMDRSSLSAFLIYAEKRHKDNEALFHWALKHENDTTLGITAKEILATGDLQENIALYRKIQWMVASGSNGKNSC